MHAESFRLSWKLRGGAQSPVLAFQLTKVVCSAAGIAALTTLWGEFFCAKLKGQVRAALAAMMCLAFAENLGLLMLDDAFSSAGILMCALISCGIYLFLLVRYLPMGYLPNVSAEESDARCRVTRKSRLLTIMGSVAQGFALCWLLFPEVHAVNPVYAGALLSFLSVALVFFDSIGNLVLREAFVRKMFLPVLAACFLALLFTPSEWRFVPCLLAFAFSLLPYESAVFAICEHIVRCDLCAIRAFADGRLCSVFGLSLGVGVGLLAFASDAFGDNTLQVWVFVVVMFFVLVSAVLNVNSFYPGEETSGSESVAESANDGIVGRRESVSSVDVNQYLQKKCDAVAEQFGLTGRQTEVLYLLARGRNAAYIQDKLVISPHTVKSHIYTIYKKIDCHSQQELIDLLDGLETKIPPGGASR